MGLFQKFFPPKIVREDSKYHILINTLSCIQSKPKTMFPKGQKEKMFKILFLGYQQYRIKIFNFFLSVLEHLGNKFFSQASIHGCYAKISSNHILARFHKRNFRYSHRKPQKNFTLIAVAERKLKHIKRKRRLAFLLYCMKFLDRHFINFKL